MYSTLSAEKKRKVDEVANTIHVEPEQAFMMLSLLACLTDRSPQDKEVMDELICTYKMANRYVDKD